MDNQKIYIIGSCSIEDRDFFIEQAHRIYPLMKGKNWYLKGSFDKANRTSVYGERGPGILTAIEIFKEVKSIFPDIKITTDVHEVNQIEKLSGLVDVIQIPAFLCRQTDLIVEAAKNFNIVNIKKGQWMSPQNMAKGVDKIKITNPNCEAWVTERGTQFGYTQLIVDFGSVDYLKDSFDRVILDCTHSTQKLKSNGRTGGDPNMAVKYWKVADIFGYDGVFVETHPFPEKATSDMDSQIQFDVMKSLLDEEFKKF